MYNVEENIEEIFNEILVCDVKEALKYCNDGLKKSGNPEYLIYVGHAQLVMGHFEDAILAIDLAFELGCDYYVYGYNVKGEALLELGLYVESRRCFEMVLFEEPEQYLANKFLLELDIREELYEDAVKRCIDYLEKYNCDNKQIAELKSAIGWIYLVDLNMVEEAYKSFKEAVEAYPNYSRAYTGLGIYEAYKKNYQEGINYFTKAANIDENDGENFFGLAICNKELKNYDLVEGYLMQANALQPEDNRVLEEFAFELLRQERYDEALEYLYQILEFNEDNNEIKSLISEVKKNINEI